MKTEMEDMGSVKYLLFDIFNVSGGWVSGEEVCCLMAHVCVCGWCGVGGGGRAVCVCARACVHVIVCLCVCDSECVCVFVCSERIYE